MVGTIKRVIADKGFGFIRRSGGERDLFFHVRDLKDSLILDESLEGLTVEYEIEETEKGPRAANVRAAR